MIIPGFDSNGYTIFTMSEKGWFRQAIERIPEVAESGSFLKPAPGILYPTTAWRKSGPVHSNSPHLYV